MQIGRRNRKFCHLFIVRANRKQPTAAPKTATTQQKSWQKCVVAAAAATALFPFPFLM